MKIFVPTAAAILPILLPLSIVHGKKPDAGVQGLNRLTWGGVGLDRSSYYWAYLVLALVLVGQALYTIYEELRFYVQIRHRHLSSHSTSHTVLISNIPNHLCSNDQLSATYEKLVGGAYRILLLFQALYPHVGSRPSVNFKYVLCTFKWSNTPAWT